MRAVAVSMVLALVAGPLFAQVPQKITNTELMRYLDRATEAMKSASQDAANNNVTALRQSLKRTSETWMDCYGRYRHWASADTNWQKDFDNITTAVVNATNALTPGNNIPNCKAQIDYALGVLTALRDRNGVPDLRATVDEAAKSLQAMQTTAKALQGKRLTPADLTSLQSSYQQATESWQHFSQAVIDLNALGLSSGQLDEFRQLIALQNLKFDTINNVLRNPDTARLVAEIQSARDQLAQLIEQLNPNLPDSTGDEPTVDSSQDGGTDAKAAGPGRRRPLRDRPRLLPRLR